MTDDPLVTAEALGDWLGVSNSAVQEATARGVLTKASRGRWPLKASVRAYCEHMRRLVVGRGEGTAAAERGRLAHAHAVLATLKAKKLAGELVAADGVKSEWVHVMSQLRARLLAAPSRVQQARPHLTAGDIEALDREIREALEELADAAEMDAPPS